MILTAVSIVFLLFLWGLTVVLEGRAKRKEIEALSRGDTEAATYWRRHFLN